MCHSAWCSVKYKIDSLIFRVSKRNEGDEVNVAKDWEEGKMFQIKQEDQGLEKWLSG